jgi:hypothetical protein
MLNGSTVTSTPSKAGCGAVAVGLGIRVAALSVGEAAIWVGASVAGTNVFAGNEVGLVGGAIDTDKSQARDITINRERNKRTFFTIVLCIVKFPFILNRTHQKEKTPPPPGESLTIQMDSCL